MGLISLDSSFTAGNKTAQITALNPFAPNTPFLYPLKTSENLTVYDLRVHWKQMG